MRIKLILILLTFTYFINDFSFSVFSETQNNEKKSFNNKKNISNNDYIIGEGDVLGIKILDLPDSDIETTVLSDGSIQIPLIGDIKISNLTLNQAKEKIENKLSKELIRPDIFINLRYEKPLKIYVIGEVNKPGYYTFHKSLKNENPDLKISSFGLPTVLDGIQQAGGITSESNIKEIKLYRKLPGELKQVKFTTLDLSKILTEGDLSQNPLLMNEDVISISKAKKNDIYDNSEIVNSNLYPDKISITVIGSVVNPGVFRLASNSNLSTAIYTAGGLRPFKGKKNNVELLRIQRNGKTINKKYKLSNTESLRGKKNPILKDGDIVKVNDTNYAKLTQGLGLITEPLSQLVTTYSFIKIIGD